MVLVAHLLAEAGNSLQNSSQAHERPHIAFRGSALGETQAVGHIIVAQSLEVTQDEHLAVHGLELIEGSTKQFPCFMANCGLTGRALAASQPCGQGVGAAACVHRHFSVHGACLGCEIAPVDFDQPLFGKQSDPDPEWHVRLLGEVLLTMIGGQIDLLHDVRGGDSPVEPPVQPLLDPSMQPLGMLIKQHRQRRAIPFADQFLAQIRRWGSRVSHGQRSQPFEEADRLGIPPFPL